MRIKLRRITHGERTRYEVGIPTSVIDLLRLRDVEYLNLDIDSSAGVIFLMEAVKG